MTIREMIEKNEGELSINIPSGNIRLTAMRQLPEGAANADEKATSAQTIELKAAPAINTLTAGLYLITVEQLDRKIMQFPVTLERDQREELKLDIPEKFPENMIYIPDGSFIFGDRTFDDQFARIRLDAFFISRYEVTIGEYLNFWQSLPSSELKERYRAYVENPAEQSRKLMPLWDDSGKLISSYALRMPVVGITVEAMEAYCKYMTGKTGFAYRLPTALEWEKAARGVDGREYVWGNTFRKNAACLKTSDSNVGTTPQEVGKFSDDCSVYGVYDMTGNARELVTNPGSWQYYTVKGASFKLPENSARLTAHAYSFNLSDVGFRCAVSAPENSNQ